MAGEMKLIWCHSVVSFLVLVFMNTASSHSIIKTVPGYPGPLPFKLETGYIGVGENDDELQLFYYFLESEKNPETDPLLLWIPGGPGCSGFSSLVYQIGPLAFDIAAFDGSLPSFVINPYSYNKLANIIFLDSPAGTGFSYAATAQGYINSDTKKTNYDHLFLRKFLKNPVYLGGDSYGGKIVPMVALEIVKGNEAGLEPRVHLQGYILGNAWREPNADINERIPYAHGMALIPNEYFELAKNSCKGKYLNPDPNNVGCLSALQLVGKCIDAINIRHILEPNCNYLYLKSNGLRLNKPNFVEDDPIDLIFLPKHDQLSCRRRFQLMSPRRRLFTSARILITHKGYNYVTSYVWANDQTVQEALHIRKGKVADWRRCNTSLSYAFNFDVQNVLTHHQLLNEKGLRVLAYSGDHDLVVPYLSTLKWIRKLNLSLVDGWRPWTVDGQIAGYTLKYENSRDYLTFATVKGAGHNTAEYYPKESFAMFERWLSFFPL